MWQEMGKSYIRQKRKGLLLTLMHEERLLIEERIKAGYYSAENIGKRGGIKTKMLKRPLKHA